jgi:membrane-associated phospholipid phosphatase
MKRATGPAGGFARTTVEPLEARTLWAGDVVLQWNEVLLDAVRADRALPPVAARAMAMVHIAVYDAVNAIAGGYEGYLLDARVPRRVSMDAAAASAAHDVLVNVFPAQTAVFDARLAESLAAVRNGFGEAAGVLLGKVTAALVLRDRADDGSADSVPYTIGDGPGEWQPTPPAYQQAPALAHWGYVEPFALRSGSQFRPDGPPALTSDAYAAAFDEVKSLGSATSTTRTPDQTLIARFWSDGAGTATPPGHWNEIAQDVSEQRGNSVAQNARMFALLNISQADAAIVSWDAKYVYDFWRPVTGIRAADTDGNPDTAADPAWTALLVTPPFPSYTSGHSTFSSAAAATLAHFYGTDAIPFTTTDDDTPGITRSFTSFSAAAGEAGMSRIYGGIHWSFDNVAGQESGRRVGNFVARRMLTPTRGGRPHSHHGSGAGGLHTLNSADLNSGRGLLLADTGDLDVLSDGESAKDRDGGASI